MWLIHQFGPLINLGICKEFPNMPRAKTTRGNNGRTETSTSQTSFAPEVKKTVVPINLEDEIRRRAYEIYEQRGYLPGHEHDDWFTAEREVLARYSQQRSA
jgi:Protein of unknown function (DUF2934)